MTQQAKHTPGPWFVGEDRAEDCSDHANSGLALVDTGRQEDWPIARLVEWNNARLIAAAPDYDKGARAFVQWVKVYGDEIKPEYLNAMENAFGALLRAAIAKAEGR